MHDAEPLRDEETRLLGHWSLLSTEVELRDSGRIEPTWRSAGRGHLIFLPNRRMSAYLEATERTAPIINQDYRGAFSTMCAYTGSFSVHGDRWVTRVDGSWNVRWVGTEQVRYFRLTADSLHVSSEWYSSPLHQDAWVRAVLVWKRTLSL